MMRAAHERDVESVTFSPSENTIVSGSDDGTIKVWGFRPYAESEWEEVSETLDMGVLHKKCWHNKVTGHELAVKPSGGVL